MRTIDIIAVLALAVSRTTADLSTEGIKLPLPTREFEWKDVNFISISDSHGWLLGHQHATWPEPNYSGDYGDFASFTQHLRSLANDKGVDLLLVDAGDHHDGSGLVSSSKDSAEKADQIFNMLTYDIMTIGNHELYAYDSARWIYDNKAQFGGRYLTSNVEIEVDGEYRTVGDRFAQFTTDQGNNVTALGVIFDSHGPGLKIQAPKAMVKEDWFLEAIKDVPDYFVLVGHMPVRGSDADFHLIIEAIREYHPEVPVFVFGGHTHVRDCVKFDDRSIGVVPGRYMETIAFTSSSLSSSSSSGGLDMARRYIDANRQSYKYHTNTSDHTFDTQLGLDITTSLLRLASSLHISKPLGKSPHDYFLSRYPIGHPRHVATEFGNRVLPSVLIDKDRKGEKIVISNTGTLRFDLFQGRFDRNDELTVSPFGSAFLYIPLPAGLARNITSELNRAGASRFVPLSLTTRSEVESRVDQTYNQWMAQQWLDHISIINTKEGQVTFSAAQGGIPTMGYVTRDSCPGIGDDIEHIPVPHHGPQPDFFSSSMPDLQDSQEIDVVICDFALVDFLAAVQKLEPGLNLTEGDMKPYAEGIRVNEVLGLYAAQEWS